jgi:Uri superfamily endonuclease
MGPVNLLHDPSPEGRLSLAIIKGRATGCKKTFRALEGARRVLFRDAPPGNKGTLMGEGVISDFQKACAGKRGTYIVVYELREQAILRIGRLGIVKFPPGTFLYVGSALGRGGFWPRLRRHLSAPRRPRWHIDFFHPPAMAVEVWVRESEERLECKWSSKVKELEGSFVPVRGFGSSDCGCEAHLLGFAKRPFLEPLMLELEACLLYGSPMAIGPPSLISPET